jgi:CBS domain-containing protein
MQVIEDTAKYMEEQKVNLLLVQDDENNPIGILSESDFLKKQVESPTSDILDRRSIDVSEQKFSVCLYGGYK